MGIKMVPQSVLETDYPGYKSGASPFMLLGQYVGDHHRIQTCTYLIRIQVLYSVELSGRVFYKGS
jgi:hypothetical protein